MSSDADYAALLAHDISTSAFRAYTSTDIVGVEVGIFFMEQPRGGVKVSFRSHSVNVAQIAEQFGGGGHHAASGATVNASLDETRQRVLHAVHAALEPAD